MKIVKPNAEIKYAIIHGKQTTCYKESDCVEVDIDELAKDWIKDCTAVTIYETTMIEKPFSEYLQERMK